MGGAAILPSVVDYLSARPGEPVTLQRLATDLRMDPVKIQKALSNMLRDGGYGDSIEVVHRGQVWRWRSDSDPHYRTPEINGRQRPARAPAASPTPTPALDVGDVVEVMGITQSGEAVARDGDGRLYRVSPL